jgi:transcriptional regulator GlxA family with amidase domain
LIDRTQETVTAQSGFALEHTLDVLWSRYSLGSVEYGASVGGPRLVAYQGVEGGAEFGLVLRPVEGHIEATAIASQLASILVRLLEQHPSPTKAVIEVALALRLAYSDRQPSTTRKLAEWQRQQAMAFMNERLADGFTTADVAAQCGMAVGRFSAAFRMTFGVSIRQWAIQRRIELAQAMLSNATLSLGTVAVACGFTEQCHFTRQFSRLVGVPPGTWRRRNHVLTA